MKEWLTKKLLLLLGNPKIKDFDAKQANTVLIRLCARGIGDSVVATGAIRALKQKYPDIKIYVMQRKRSRAVFNGNPDIDKVLPVSYYHYLKLRNKVDVYVDCKDSVNVRNFLAYRLLKPKKITGSVRAYKYGLKDSNFSYYKNFNPGNFTECSHDNVFNYFSDFGIMPGKRQYDLYPAEQDIKTADDYWLKNKKRVILNIYGGNRMLDESKIISVMNNAQKDFSNLDIVIPFDYKTKKASAILCGPNGVRNARLSYKTTAPQLFALVKTCDTVISVDTGLIHVASAFDKNTVCFIEEAMLQWRPISGSYSLVICNIKDFKEGKKHYDFNSSEAEAAIKDQLSRD